MIQKNSKWRSQKTVTRKSGHEMYVSPNKNANSVCIEFFRKRDKDDGKDVLLFIPDFSCSHTVSSQGEYELKA